jgi:hypothetical protein
LSLPAYASCPVEMGGSSVARREGELDAIVGEDSVDLVGHGLDQGRQEGGGGCPAGLPGDLDESEFARTIDSDVEVELALGGLHLGDVG